MGDFVETVVREARFRAARHRLEEAATLYLGGGTPSMLSPTHLRALFGGLQTVFRLANGAEVTLEANPATFTARTATLYRQLGVTRVSLGIQSFHPRHLHTLGREHNPGEARASFHLLRQAGMPAISIDLLFAIPGQSLDDWKDTLDQTLSLEPDHISAYNLTYEEDTPFFAQMGRGRYRDDPHAGAAMFELAHTRLTDTGFRHYETSNYARPGFESVHNQAYWEGADYLGLGPSAVSTLGARRWKNIPHTGRYTSMVRQLGHAEHECEDLLPEQLRLERLALLLRTDSGVPLAHLRHIPPARLEQLKSEHLAEITSSHLRLIGRGPLLVDAVAEHLVG